MKSKQNNQYSQQNSDEIYQTAKKQSHSRESDYQTQKKRVQYDDDKYQRQRVQRKPLKNEIEQLYKNFMQRSQYTQAQKAKATIKYLNDKHKQKKARRLSQQHQIEKNAVKQAHKNQVKYFRQAWKELFMEKAMKERMMLQRLQRLRKVDEEECKERITRRCQSAKPTVVIAKLEQIQQVENLLRKRGKTVELRRIRDEKKRLIQRCRQDQEKTLIKIAEQQRKRMVDKQTKRYRSFMHRIEADKRDCERMYRREEYKIKQKFKNIFQNLEHDQKKDFNELQRSFIV